MMICCIKKMVNIKDQTASTPSKKSPSISDATKESGRLLNIILAVNYVGTALSEFKNKRADELPGSAVKDLEVLIEALDCVYDEGLRQASKVSTVGYLVEACDWRGKANIENEAPRRNMRVPESMWKGKEFFHTCRNNSLRDDYVQVKKKVTSPSQSSSPHHSDRRRSERITKTITSERESGRVTLEMTPA